MSTHQSGTFQSADGIHTIAYELIVPDNQIKGIIQLSHGMCEYFGRYHDFAEYMTEHGFLVCGNDHLGHGKSVLTQDDLGYFSPENGWQNAVADLYHLTEIIRTDYPDMPYFLFGHSMGSFLARAYCALHGDTLSAAVFCGTSGGMPAMDKMLTAIEAIRKIHDDRFRSDKLYQLAFGRYNKKIPDAQSKNDWISRDRTIVSAYDADPACHFNFTLNGYENLIGVLQYVSSEEWFLNYPAGLPALLIAGDADPVGNYGKGVYKVYRKLSAHGCDVGIRLYSGARHELLNELNRKEVYHDLLAFFRFHADKNSTVN